MGAYLHDWYGTDHVVVGFTVNRGEYTAVERGTGLGRHQLTPAESPNAADCGHRSLISP